MPDLPKKNTFTFIVIRWEHQGFGDQELLAGAAIPYPFFSPNRVIGACLAEAVYIGILK